jgi:ACS family D-galactonate transporter-like MFS transporter
MFATCPGSGVATAIAGRAFNKERALREKPQPKNSWFMAGLLFLFMVINFADKIVVGLAGVSIMADLDLTPRQFGLLGSAFFYLFSVSAIAIGFLTNFVPTKWILLGLALVWSAVQFPMVTEVNFTTLMICRIILGAGEGPAFGTAMHALYKWFPDEKRTLPTAILTQGSAFGVVIAVPALNWLIVNYSWHWAFGVLGGVSLLWAVAFLILGREGPLTEAAPMAFGPATRAPYTRLIACPTFIGCCITTFGAYWGLSIALTWVTPFVVTGLGFSQSSAGLITALPWACGAAFMLFVGWLSQEMLGWGVRTRVARGVLGAAPLIVAGLMLIAMTLAGSASAKVALLVIAMGLSGPIYVVCGPMISEFAPEGQRAALISIYCAFYALAGIAAPVAMGRAIEMAQSPLDGFHSGFRILGAILILSGLFGLALMRPDLDKRRIAACEA